MASPPDQTPADPPPGRHLPEAAARPIGRRRQLQLVWVIPLVAALIGGWIMVRSLLDHGPTITISFPSAEGLEVNKTKIKYREVDIGTVRQISFDSHFDRVLVKAELTKATAPLLVQDTRFWIVRPRVGAGGVSGLGTLLSGSYIGMDVGKSREEQYEFTGLDKPPAITTDLPGRRFNLRADDIGSLDIGSPVYYRRIQVGRVTSLELDPKGTGVTVQIFIDSPYERYVTDDSRFWQASGVDITLDASGFKVNTQSLAAILAGGIAFQSIHPDQPGAAAKEGAQFRLAPDQVQAMREPETDTRPVRMYFSESLRGLQPGAPLDFRGVVIGEVKSIGLEFDRTTHTFRFPVDAVTYPTRLLPRRSGPPDPNAPPLPDPMKILQGMIDHGLRAQLRPGNLLTGQLYVALDFFPRAAKAALKTEGDVAEIPTIGGSLGEFQSQISELLGKFNKIPYEDISTDLRATLRSTTSTLQATEKTMTSAQQLVDQLGATVPPELDKALKDLRATLAQARSTIDTAGQSLSPDAAWQLQLRQSLTEITRAATSLRTLSDYLERHPESLLRGKPGDPQP